MCKGPVAFRELAISQWSGSRDQGRKQGREHGDKLGLDNEGSGRPYKDLFLEERLDSSTATTKLTCLHLSLIQLWIPIAKWCQHSRSSMSGLFIGLPSGLFLHSIPHTCPYLCFHTPTVLPHPFAHIAPSVQKVLPTSFTLLSVSHSLRFSSGNFSTHPLCGLRVSCT